MAEIVLLYLCFGIAWAVMSLMEVHVAMTKPTTKRHRKIHDSAQALLDERYVPKIVGALILTVGTIVSIVVSISLWPILALMRVFKGDQ